jgi:hypothetical protein
MEENTPTAPFMYKMRDPLSTSRSLLTQRAKFEAETWVEKDWEDFIHRTPEDIEHIADKVFYEDFGKYIDRPYFIDDLDECKRVFTSSFKGFYLHRWNRELWSRPYYQDPYDIRVMKRERENNLLVYVIQLHDFMLLPKNCKLKLTFDKEGKIVTIEEVDE